MEAPLTTTELVARAHSGDQTAWDALVARYENLLWSVARSHRLDTADAADVVQTSWLKLLENLGRIQDPERLPGWLVTTARRECLRVLRRGGREVLDLTEVDVPDEDAPGVDDALLTRERDTSLWTAFLRLPERCQRLLRVLMATESAAYAEVSAALGMPVGAIGPTRMRCLGKLRVLVAGTHLTSGSPA